MEISALTMAAGGAAATMESAPRTSVPVPVPGEAFAEAEARMAADRAAGDAAVARARPAEAPGWKQLETLLVQQMLQSMLSSEEGGFFGKELGSDYYASFMAEQFAARLSDGLDLGIASRLDRHYGSGDDT